MGSSKRHSANKILELNAPQPELPHATENITSYEAKLQEPETCYDPIEGTKPSPTIQEINNTFNEVEMSTSFVKKTLGYLDQALNSVEQKLVGIQDLLSTREFLTNREQTLPHFETLYNSIPQVEVEDTVTGEGNAEYGEPKTWGIDHEYFDDGPQNGDSLLWRFARESHSFREDWDGNGRRMKGVPVPTWDGLLRKESEADSVGYTADDEISPPFAKVFEK